MIIKSVGFSGNKFNSSIVQDYINGGKEIIKNPSKLFDDQYKIYLIDALYNTKYETAKEIRQKICESSPFVEYYDIANNTAEYLSSVDSENIFLYGVNYAFFNKENLTAINNNKAIKKIFLMGHYHSNYKYPLKEIDMQPFLKVKKSIKKDKLSEDFELCPFSIYSSDNSKEYLFLLSDLAEVNIIDSTAEWQDSFKKLNSTIRELYIYLNWKFQDFNINILEEKDNEYTFGINIKDDGKEENIIYNYPEKKIQDNYLS